MDVCRQSNVYGFNILSRSVIAFFQLKEQASFNFIAAVTVHINFGAQENKIYHYFIVSPSTCHEVMEQDTMILVFWMLSFKPAFSRFHLHQEDL